MSAKIKILLFGFVTLVAVVPARGAEPIELRAEGSFPVKYTETISDTSRQNRLSAGPYLAFIASGRLQPDLSVSLFAEGGQERLTGFRETNNTFASFGGNIVKRWGAFLTGMSVEHIQFFQGPFGFAVNDANDLNVFARYHLKPNADLRISPMAIAATRLDDALSVQRYSFSARVDIEHRLVDSWWLVAMPRVRLFDYVGASAGRRDVFLAALAGLKYEFNDNVSLIMLAGYETISSNFAGRSLDRLLVGASIDFNFNFGRDW